MNRYIILLLTTLLGLASASSAQSDAECPCSPYPFVPDPPCFNYCAATVIKMSTVEELFDVLSLPEETQAEIVSLRAVATGSPARLDEGYSEEAQEQLRAAFDQANQGELSEMLSRLFSS
jgi:hypothetical protein